VHWQEQLFGPVIVVGVRYEDPMENNRRTFDLTPKPAPGTDPRSAGDVGGEDAFLAFMQDTLKPAIARRAKVDIKRQALFGHSLGGLFALHVLLSQPQAFDTYVIGSPSINQFGHEVLQELPAFQAHGVSGAPRRVLITAGGLERNGPSPEELRFAKRNNIPIPPPVPPGHDMVSEASAMAKSLQSVKGVQVQFVGFPDETHNSSIPALLGRGARWTLSGWYPR
jgi:pimeloyl-ACP methyl ester carboxylesterase